MLDFSDRCHQWAQRRRAVGRAKRKALHNLGTIATIRERDGNQVGENMLGEAVFNWELAKRTEFSLYLERRDLKGERNENRERAQSSPGS